MSALANGLFGYAALTAAIAGFAGLSLAMDRHWESLHGRGSSPGDKTPWLQGAGSAGLLLSLLLSIALRGATQGWVLWLGMLTAGAIIVVLMLTYRVRQLMPLARAAGISAIIATAAGALL